MTVSLQAPDGYSPLAFEQYEHLHNGKGYAMLAPDGSPLQGSALDQQLALEGMGPKVVRVTLDYADTGAGDLKSTVLETTALGTLDSQGLARIIHAQARQFTGARAKGNSPALMFVRGIEVAGPEQPKPVQPTPVPARTKRNTIRRQYVKVVSKRTGKTVSRAIYRDKTTGRFAKRSEWQPR